MTNRQDGGSEKMVEVDPLECLTSNRLDLIFKLNFGHALKNHSSSSYSRKMYIKHLFSITGKNGKFIEYGNVPRKQGIDQFIETFASLLNGNSNEFPPIHIAPNLQLNNGAHRVATGILLNQKLMGIVDPTSRGTDAGYEFFRRANRYRYRISREDLDFALLKLTKLSPKISVLVVFPTLKSSGVLTELRNHEGFFLERKFFLGFRSRSKLLDLLYPNPTNFVNQGSFNKSNSFRDRFYGCGTIKFFFFENLTDSDMIQLKLSLRAKYKLKPGSLHTPDNRKEMFDLLEVLLVKNSRRNFKFFDLVQARQVADLFFKPNNRCIDCVVVGSTPLSILSLRDARDLDILLINDSNPSDHVKFDVHNHYWWSKGFNINEISENPRHFFIVFGVKYASIAQLFKFKMARRERKDLTDLMKYVRMRLVSLLQVSMEFHFFFMCLLRDLKTLFL